MAKAQETNGNGAEKALITEWAKAQKNLEAAQKAEEEARLAVQGYGKRIFEVRGTKSFEVKALGRRYRAVKKPSRIKGEDGKPIGEDTFHVIPLPDEVTSDSF